jgi:hypothetical protein
MKLRFLRTPANLPAFREGTAHEVADEPAEKFVKAGIAVKADGPDDVFAKNVKALKDGKPVDDEDAGYTDEEIEAAANKVEFTDKGEDSKANRPPPHAGAIPTGAGVGGQRSQPQNPSVPAGEADGPKGKDAAKTPPKTGDKK